MRLEPLKIKRLLHLPALGELIGDALHPIANRRYAFVILIRQGPDDFCDFHHFSPPSCLVYLGAMGVTPSS
jgi:hypothetical protein